MAHIVPDSVSLFLWLATHWNRMVKFVVTNQFQIYIDPDWDEIDSLIDVLDASEYPDEPDLDWKAAEGDSESGEDVEAIETVFESEEDILIVSDSEGNGTEVSSDDGTAVSDAASTEVEDGADALRERRPTYRLRQRLYTLTDYSSSINFVDLTLTCKYFSNDVRLMRITIMGNLVLLEVIFKSLGQTFSIRVSNVIERTQYVCVLSECALSLVRPHGTSKSLSLVLPPSESQELSITKC